MSKHKTKQKQKMAQAHSELKDLVERLTQLNRSVKSLCDTFGEIESARSGNLAENATDVSQVKDKLGTHTLH